MLPKCARCAPRICRRSCASTARSPAATATLHRRASWARRWTTPRSGSRSPRVDGAIVGYLMARADLGDFGRTAPVAVLDTIGVDPAYEHRGIGRARLANLGALQVDRVGDRRRATDLGLLGFLHHTGFEPSQRLSFRRECMISEHDRRHPARRSAITDALPASTTQARDEHRRARPRLSHRGRRRPRRSRPDDDDAERLARAVRHDHRSGPSPPVEGICQRTPGQVQLVWEPIWNPSMMSEVARTFFGWQG